MAAPKTSLRTPTARVRGLGASKKGTGHFIALRTLAVAMAPLGLWFLWAVISHAGAPYAWVPVKDGEPAAAARARQAVRADAACEYRRLLYVALTRAADVTLKERRPLVLLARETPLHLGHLRNMVAATEMGAIVCPPVPAFYRRPRTVEDIIEHSVSRALDALGIEQDIDTRWPGLPPDA